MSDFEAIETREQFEEAVKDRLEQEKETVRREFSGYLSPEAVEEKYKEYLSPKEAEEKYKGYLSPEDAANKDATIAKYEKESKRVKVAMENGIPYELAGKLSGETEDEMKKDAEAFSKFLKGKSSLAVLSGQTPIPFNGLKEFIFSMDNEIDIVAENGKKSEGGITVDPVKIVPIKFEYGARVSDEFLYATEEEQLDILTAFNNGFAAKVAKGFDLAAFHGINPRTGGASTVVGTNHFDSKVTQKVKYTKGTPDTNLDAAIAMVQGSDGDVTGIALSNAFGADMATVKENGVRQYPEFRFGASPESLGGMKTSVNKTVYNDTVKDHAIVGDFSNAFKWGFSKEIPLEIIKYGDPDNTEKDLKGYNQVYIRAEVYLGWGILVPEYFARVVDED